MSTPVSTSSTDSQMHNNIMAAGSKDRPPMLGPGRYSQWRSHEIYSTVDACNTANEMWIAIERLQQGESLNVQDVKTNLFWEFGKFTSRDGELHESIIPVGYGALCKKEDAGRSKAVTDDAYHKEKMIMCQQANQGVPLQASKLIARGLG
ncbi:hypothetical protein Tco_0729968 [Tanacetum coccineum]|uniref:Uncharacterized protein n=1 Tax=Tanacetum coccineum TaxID=301880 RepID=A0ABQ4YR93_9ASTR